jgi:transposase
MELKYPKCAGLDVHKDSVVACVRIVEDSESFKEVQTFDTMTDGLCDLKDWLASYGVTRLGMEATGIYWRPVWHILSDGFSTILANASEVKARVGKKTDVMDAMRLADLTAYDTFNASFVPPTEIQDIRKFTRLRTKFVRERKMAILRIQKELEDANIKFDSLISDIVGVAGRAVLNAISKGVTNAKDLVKYIKTKVKASKEDLEKSLNGFIRPAHITAIRLHLASIDTFDRNILIIDNELNALFEPFRKEYFNLTTAPGVGPISAKVIIGEIGTDMSQFPTDSHIRSWTGLSPRNDESAGKKRNTSICKGNTHLKTVLVQCAWASVKIKDSMERAMFYKLRGRCGARKAIIAVAASLLTTVYHMLRTGQPWKDTRKPIDEEKAKENKANRLVKTLEKLGYTVTAIPN